jgi:hypothetical protein
MRNDFILWQKKNKKKFPLIKQYCFVYGNYIYTKKKKNKTKRLLDGTCQSREE